MKISLETEQFLLENTGASKLTNISLIQNVWSNYGQILRIGLQGAETTSVVVKIIQSSAHQKHPRGWNSTLGHSRKLRSYQVEHYWYQHYASRCQMAAVPQCVAQGRVEDALILVLEDLSTCGFPLRLQQLNGQQLKVCIRWLACFHATFMHQRPVGLWPIGTYWHLATRPEELKALDDKALQQAATAIDSLLNNCHYQSIVHGDAKIANFLFSKDTSQVSAVDFQYVGAGCGMKDLAYLIGSCMDENECEKKETVLLNYYFEQLQLALRPHAYEGQEIEREWRPMYRIAWADFHRFIKGWSPGHWKINSYSERITDEVVRQMNQ